jgi:hypothetical protein
MSGYLDSLTFPVLDVRAIWCPEKERMFGKPLATAIEEQAKAGLLAGADTVGAILRRSHGETEIERVFEPTQGYDPEIQPDWDNGLAGC